MAKPEDSAAPARPTGASADVSATTTNRAKYGMGLLAQHVQVLAERGVPPEVAGARTYRSVDEKTQAKRLGFTPSQHRVPALGIPVWSPLLREVATWQLRPDDPRMDSKRARPVKYETAASRTMALDANPLIHDRLRDPSVPLFITEGVLKADAAIGRGLCCIALLGDWNWRGTNDQGGTAALADFEAIALNGRRVYIVLDSDVMVNPGVRVALERLAGLLARRGADIAFVYLPAGSQQDKGGP